MESAALTTIDHAVIAVRDLDAASETYARLLGRRPSWRGSHPGAGTANVLFRLDNTYLEPLARPVPMARRRRRRGCKPGEWPDGHRLRQQRLRTPPRTRSATPG
jgi:catechol 2,3-dioxygenase-like lactoylglutathione lyase family enzyme